MHWLAQGLRKVKFRWNQVSLWQHRILKETSFKICIEKGKKSDMYFVSSCCLRERDLKMSDTCSLFPPFGDSWSSCLLLSQREKQQVIYKGNPIGLTGDLSAETLQARREGQAIFNVLRGKKSTTKITVLSKDLIQN